MSDPLFLGVDGGGTACRARVRDAGGRLLGEGSAGPANARLGPSAFGEIMKSCRQAVQSAGMGEGDLPRVHAGFGLAGAGQAVDRAFIRAQSHPFASLTVDTDAYAAWLGAFQGRDGAILIVGTGSCGLAVVGGKRFNVGGWGPEVSDDGSGAAMGRAAIRRSLWALEGIAPMTPLAKAILAEFGEDPEAIVAWAGKARPADYAHFAKTVFAFAEERDPLAVALIEEAAGDIARMVARLTEIGAPSVALVGGMTGALTEWLPENARARLVEPVSDAIDGAILMARQAFARAAEGAN